MCIWIISFQLFENDPNVIKKWLNIYDVIFAETLDNAEQKFKTLMLLSPLQSRHKGIMANQIIGKSIACMTASLVSANTKDVDWPF